MAMISITLNVLVTSRSMALYPKKIQFDTKLNQRLYKSFWCKNRVETQTVIVNNYVNLRSNLNVSFMSRVRCRKPDLKMFFEQEWQPSTSTIFKTQTSILYHLL